LDRDNPDERRILIEAEHPELHGALGGGLHEIELNGTTMNPVLHIAMHEIVVNQLWDDDPPEMWQTAQRLLAQGYPRHDVLHMLASVVSTEVFEIMRSQEPHDIERVRAALAALPESWEPLDAETPTDRPPNRAERRAQQRAAPHRRR
jgi:hypothetical protein